MPKSRITRQLLHNITQHCGLRTSEKFGDLRQVGMLVSHMAKPDQADLLGRVDAIALLPVHYTLAVGTDGLDIWHGETTVRRGLPAYFLGAY
jgi:hypothetical protein